MTSIILLTATVAAITATFITLIIMRKDHQDPTDYLDSLNLAQTQVEAQMNSLYQYVKNKLNTKDEQL